MFGAALTKGSAKEEPRLGVQHGITKEQLQLCLDYTQQMLQNAVKEMVNGLVEQHPYDGECSRCDYLSACNYKDLGGQEDKVKNITFEILAKVTKK